MDKYAMISFIPSMAVVVGCVAMCVVGARYLRKFIEEDAAKAAEEHK
ncbi:MAG: hypothetical protein OIF57_19600 [Marinobacterium sp.]|nr:hypothetical protein [Marinobacterium sp.]